MLQSKNTFLKTLLAVLVCLALSVPAWAQVSSSATVNGTVVDATGAVVPQASVVVSNEATGIQTTTHSNDDGGFLVPGLVVGTYTVVVTKTGFQAYRETGLVLHPATVATVNVTMKVGAVTSEVTVAASAAQVQTSTNELSSEVSGEQVGILPLNGRNYESLAALMPGVTQLSPDTGLGLGAGLTQNSISINGMSFTGSMYYLDGIWNVGTGSFAENVVTPNPDSIQEVRVLQNNYGVQYNLIGPNVVLVETKSGTSTFHGSLFEYLRNDALDARNFFSPTVPALKQNIFGGSLGGPIFVPGHRGSPRTFFFGTMEWERLDRASVDQAAIPTAAEREGIFSSAITNPVTGQPFPQTATGQYQIPQAQLNPQALTLMNALTQLPNNAANGFLNYLNLTPSTTPSRQDEIKVDHEFGDKIRLMGEYLDEPQTSTPGPSPFSITRYGESVQNKLAQLQLTATISPTMVNTTSIGFANYVVNLLAAGSVYLDQVPNFQEQLPYSGFLSNRLPYVTFAQGWAAFGTNAPYPLNHAGDHNIMVTDDWNWLRGNHSIEIGGNIMKYGKKQNVFTSSNGQWYFSGQFTGNPVADYLLGDSATFFQQSTETRPYPNVLIESPYIQDRWKATRRLTLTGGLRINHLPQTGAQRGILSAFNPALYNPAEAPIVNTNGTITVTPHYNPLNGIVINGENGVPLNLTNSHNWYWEPSVGFAYDVFGDGKTALRGGFSITNAMVPANTDCSYDCAGNIPTVESLTLIDAPFPNPIGAASAPLAASSLGGAISGNSGFNLQASRVETFSLSLQHEFPGGWLVSLAGAGVAAEHVQDEQNINQPLPDPPYNYNPLINTGTVFPYIYAPYQGYGSMLTYLSNDVANWTALEVSVRHPVGHNVFFNVSFTWQHDLSNDVNAAEFQGWSATQDAYHTRQNYGNTPNNVPQILSFSLIWNLPWEKNARGLRRTALGGWRFSDMTTIQDGFSMVPGITSATEGLATRPDRAAGTSSTGPKTVNEWFNSAAFTYPAAGYFGDAAPGSIGGPGVVDFDAALYKDFRIKERHTFQFRAELFNAFNHTNFSGVQTTLGAGNYGMVTSALDPRIAEFALRYQF